MTYNIDEQISQLNKQATQFAKTDMLKAIDCLREVRKLLKLSKLSYPIETYMRLPKYLYRNNQYDESMIEFNNLINELPSIAKKDIPRNNDTLELYQLRCKWYEMSNLSNIYDTMASINKRAKKLELMEQCQLKAQQADDEARKLDKLVN